MVSITQEKSNAGGLDLRNILIGAVLLFSTPASAEPVRLVCTQDTGQRAGIVIIDEEAGTFKHGDYRFYRIVSNTDEYLTAMGSGGTVPGGAVWIVEKATGRFAMGEASLSCTTSSCTDEKLSAFEMEGVCQRAVL